MAALLNSLSFAFANSFLPNSPGKVRFHLEQIVTEFFCHSEFL